jgi:hypothetical protein
MFFDGEYRFLGKVDVSPLRHLIESMPEDDWYKDTGRQEAFAAHRMTQSIGLVFDPDMRHEQPTVRPAFDTFRAAIEPAIESVHTYFETNPPAGTDGHGYVVRALLVRLDGGGSIASHRDHGYSLSRAHRVHLPVITSPHAEFGIAGRVRHLPAGEMWEVNNRKVHAVRNTGGAARVHLILDYVIPGEAVADPEGPLVA